MVAKIISALLIIGIGTMGAMMMAPTSSEMSLQHKSTPRVIQNGEIVYPSAEDAAIISNIPLDSIQKAIQTGEPIQGVSFEVY